jgi:hypothetical protein
MLAGTSFGDDFLLAHTFCQQRLTQHLIGFMGTAVEQIFTLEVELGFFCL